MREEVQKLMAAAETTNAKVELLGQESGRAMRLVFAESEKFAAKVATDQAEMDSKTESFRAAGAGLEAQLSEGLGKIKEAQAAADAGNLIQAESTRNTHTREASGARRRDALAQRAEHLPDHVQVRGDRRSANSSSCRSAGRPSAATQPGRPRLAGRQAGPSRSASDHGVWKRLGWTGLP